MTNNQKYFVYGTKIFSARGGYRQAKLISEMPQIKSPRQHEPFGVEINFVYQIDFKFEAPDNYFESNGFSLYSERLVELLNKYGVKHEKFPVKMVDKDENEIKDSKYFVFHSLEGLTDGLDEDASGYREGDPKSIKNLVLDYTKFEPKPLILLDKVYLPLMREDLKKEIDAQGITGFRFLAVDKYVLNEHGIPPEFED